MSYDLFVDSDNSLQFDPEFDYADEERKVEDSHRVRSGGLYRYKWASYRRFKFSMAFVSSSDAAIVNSWWLSNTELLFMNTSDSAVFSVQLVNADKPLGQFQKPYVDLYKGIIELETY